ncbi:MAG TPA: MarR family winged helix-turn-helix transcriptional regulator [Coriobacteriia bacterium]|nr:MarR family winged helix-turn-helix transcriptional regulator [Coriobacteriia bacterium]
MNDKRSYAPSAWTICRIGRRFQSFLDSRAAEFGVTSAQVPLLTYLWEGNEGHTQNEIAKALGVDKGTVSRNVATLVRRGLVTQRSSRYDSRACVVSLTPEGERLAAPIAQITEEWCGAVSSELGSDGFSAWTATLDRVDATASQLLAEGSAF